MNGSIGGCEDGIIRRSGEVEFRVGRASVVMVDW